MAAVEVVADGELVCIVAEIAENTYSKRINGSAEWYKQCTVRYSNSSHRMQIYIQLIPNALLLTWFWPNTGESLHAHPHRNLPRTV
jgi:hypothetical protein